MNPQDDEQLTVPPDRRPLSEQPAWRQDFPVDVEQDNYVARRDFTKFLVLISGAFASGQLWIGAQNWLRSRRGQPPVTKIASLDQVAVGASVTFRYPGPHDDCILVRPAEDLLVAYSQKCTHLACPVIPEMKHAVEHRAGPKHDDADHDGCDGGCLHCPAHHGKFDLLTGRAIAGPPRRPLPKITLSVRGNDVYATGVEVRTV